MRGVKVLRTEDSVLLQGLLEGKEQALRDLRRLLFPMVLDLVRRHGGQHGQAHELFEEGVIVLYECACKPNFALRSKLSTLFYSICRNLYFRELREKNHRDLVRSDEDLAYIDQSVDIESAIALKERLDHFNNIFAQLGEDCRRLLTLAIHEELPAEDIAKLMNFGSVGYLYKRKSQCKDKLLKLFEKGGDLDQY